MHEGQNIGGYVVRDRVGRGGMGVVYRAESSSGSDVALKMLHPEIVSSETRVRLAREVESLQRINHEGVARVLDADLDAELPFIVTEFVDGPTLDARVSVDGPLNRGELAVLGGGLGEALAAIHHAQVVHRDVKPTNIMLSDGKPIIIDFGVAHVADASRITQTGLVMGTPGYLAPEVISHAQLSPATDWWGWAATMTFASTGRHPFGTGTVDMVLARLHSQDPDLDGVPPELHAVLSGGLTIDQSARPKPAQLRLAIAALAAAVERADTEDASTTVLTHGPRSKYERDGALPQLEAVTSALPDDDAMARGMVSGAAGGGLSSAVDGGAVDSETVAVHNDSQGVSPRNDTSTQSGAAHSEDNMTPRQPRRVEGLARDVSSQGKPGEPAATPLGSAGADPDATQVFGGATAGGSNPDATQVLGDAAGATHVMPGGGAGATSPMSAVDQAAHGPGRWHQSGAGQQPATPATPAAGVAGGGQPTMHVRYVHEDQQQPGSYQPTQAQPGVAGAGESTMQQRAANLSQNAAFRMLLEPSRAVMIASFGVVMLLIGTIQPFALLVLGGIWCVVAGTMTSSLRALQRRREEFGDRSSDRAMVSVGTPWRLLVSAMRLIWPLILAVALALLIGLITSFALQDGVKRHSEIATFVTALIAIMLMWRGPAGPDIRFGTRAIARNIAPGPTSALIFMAVMLLVMVSSVLVVLGQDFAPEWIPLDQAPWISLQEYLDTWT